MKPTLILGQRVGPPVETISPLWLWALAVGVPLLYLAAIGAVTVATEWMQ